MKFTNIGGVFISQSAGHGLIDKRWRGTNEKFGNGSDTLIDCIVAGVLSASWHIYDGGFFF